MARRNPMNPRYQKHTAPGGKTRKSASSAKLKRDESSSSSAKKKQERPSFQMPPASPEMKKWRRIWWGLILGALLFATSILIPQVKANQTLATVALAGEFALLAAAVYIDWKIIRPLRKEAVEQAKKERKKGQ